MLHPKRPRKSKTDNYDEKFDLDNARNNKSYPNLVNFHSNLQSLDIAKSFDIPLFILNNEAEN